MAAGSLPDGLARLCWEGMTPYIPQSARRRWRLHQKSHMANPEPGEGMREWQERLDKAFAEVLRLDLRRLRGTSLTKQSARGFGVAAPKFAPLSRVSPDGISFPQDPIDFKAEVVRQAREL